MKKLFSSIICFCLLIVSAFTFAACSSEKVSIDDAADRVEEVQVAQTSFLSVLTEESVSDSRTPQEQGIMGATAEGFEMLAFLAYEVVLLDEFDDGKYVPEENDNCVITKKGNTYTLAYNEDDITKVVVTSNKDSITLTADETNVLKFTLAKNYLRIDVKMVEGEDVMTNYAEIKTVGNNHYCQLVSVQEESYNVLYAKYNFTETEVDDVETVTINSFAVAAKEGETTEPTSLKNVKDFTNFITGEGVITYTASAQ